MIDKTIGIAGPYCSKILADAGADVIKVESLGGDPSRSWGSGALFEYLNTSKRSVFRDGTLLENADVVILDDPAQGLDFLQRADPTAGKILVTITPFGLEGPWAGRPWTEFTLQAACGSIGQRGLPENPPIAAGGRIGEWVAGTYAAVGVLAALRGLREAGRGTHVDVAILDCMAVSMVTYPSLFAQFTGWPPLAGTGRSIQLPSIEPTSDGCVVFTANSGQQFHDFLVMIDRIDMLDDPEWSQVGPRFARRREFLDAIRAKTRSLTTEELLESAALFRIPAAPVLDAAGVLSFDHFVERGVFVPTPSHSFVQPRVPYQISGSAAQPFSPAPSPGQHDRHVQWTSEERWSNRWPKAGTTQDASLPLAGIRVVDCTAWWAGPSATHVLAALGADVIKVESTSRPDQMRLTSVKRPPEDQWWEWGPIFHGVNLSKRALTLDLSDPEGLTLLRKLLTTADVFVENFTPRVMDQFGLTWEQLHELNPMLIMARMPAFGLDGPWRDRTGFAQTMEAVCGLAWRTGYEDDLPSLVLGACDPVAGMHAAIAILLALEFREASGEGSQVESVMVEAALNIAAEALVEFSATGTVLGRHGNRSLSDAPQGLYPCSEHDSWVAISVATDDQWQSLKDAVGGPDWLSDQGLLSPGGRRLAHDRLDEWLTQWTSTRRSTEVAGKLSGVGVPCEVVIAARDVINNPQLQFRGLFELEDHPVTGAHLIPTLPFRTRFGPPWLHNASPTLGQHNEELLRELDVDEADMEGLRRRGVIGTHLTQ